MDAKGFGLPPAPPLPSAVELAVAKRAAEILSDKKRYDAAQDKIVTENKLQSGPTWSPEAVRKREEDRARNDRRYDQVLPLSKRLWSSVQTWEDVQRLGGLVSRGAIASPWYLALTTDSEDNPDWDPTVSALLSEINERGILTTNGQAGQTLDPNEGSLQRAYLTGIGVSKLVQKIVLMLNRVPGIIAYWTLAGCPLQIQPEPCAMRDNVLTYDYADAFTRMPIGGISEDIENIAKWNPSLAKFLSSGEHFAALYVIDTIPSRNILLLEVVAALRAAGTLRVTGLPLVAPVAPVVARRASTGFLPSRPQQIQSPVMMSPYIGGAARLQAPPNAPPSPPRGLAPNAPPSCLAPPRGLAPNAPPSCLAPPRGLAPQFRRVYRF